MRIFVPMILIGKYTETRVHAHTKILNGRLSTQYLWSVSRTWSKVRESNSLVSFIRILPLNGLLKFLYYFEFSDYFFKSKPHSSPSRYQFRKLKCNLFSSSSIFHDHRDPRPKRKWSGEADPTLTYHSSHSRLSSDSSCFITEPGPTTVTFTFHQPKTHTNVPSRLS